MPRPGSRFTATLRAGPRSTDLTSVRLLVDWVDTPKPNPINLTAMDRAAPQNTVVAERVASSDELVKVQRGFSISMLVSGIRCVLAYVILPFVTPFLGLAPGIGPGLGIIVGGFAIGANLFSIRRFWALRHPWRKPITILHILVIGFLLVLVTIDVAQLL